MDISTAGRLDHIHKNSRFQPKNMATGLTNIGNTFGGQTSSAFQSTPVDDDDDDVVFVEPVQVSQSTPQTGPRRVGGFTPSKKDIHRADPKSHSSSKESDSAKGTIISETIIIDDEEDLEPCIVQEKNSSSFSDRLVDTSRPIIVDFPSSFSRSKASAGANSTGITTEPDSEIQIANVTTLESGINSVNDSHLQNAEGRDMNLMITHVTSLQNPGLGDVQNGLHSNNFGVHMQTYSSTAATQSKPSMGPYNPGRIVSGDIFQNGESATHPNPDSWLSQSASFPRNQKQPVVDSSSPVASLPKQVIQSPSQQQQQQPPPAKAVKVTCANCKKPLQKGQTAYQRKGSTHLFCSTTCLSSFSHKPAPKKLCTMCKKDITTMKGTIVAQVDSSESFQEFCSTYCLSVYEDKQNSAKNQSKSRCTICGKLTEIRHEVSFKNMTHKLCSDHCFNRYRMANGLIMNCCEQCGEYLPSKGAGNNVLMVEGQWKRFCSPVCLNDFKLKHGKLTSCTGCKAQCRCFDMTQCIGTNGHMEPYCSTTCMNTHKAKTAKPPTQNAGIICHFCKKTSLPQYQATMPDGKLYNFCSSGCVAKFQSLSMQSNGQHASSDIQLKCNYCKNTFSSKPATLEWENKVHQFCGTTCCDDYKKLHCIVTYCEYCQEEKTLHEVIKFSGIKKPFCSEGCKLLYKQDFAKRLGLKCVTCNYCFQMCKRGATKEYDGMLRDFCTEECSKKFHEWYYKAARCDCCRTQGTLREKVQWRGVIKNFCDQHCLLRFYSQQNEPNLSTQKGPENMHYDQGSGHTPRTRSLGSGSSAPTTSKDMKNKAVLCKPLTMTKATYCKPHMQGKFCQTEQEDWEEGEHVKTKYVPVPIPVPVYIPAPMQLYSHNIPTPTAVPVPVPIPIFLPDSLLHKIQNETAKDVNDIMEIMVNSPLSTVEKGLLYKADTVEENPVFTAEFLERSPIATEESDRSPLPLEEMMEASPMSIEEVVVRSPAPSDDEMLDDDSLPLEDTSETSPSQSVELLGTFPLPAEQLLENNPLFSEAELDNSRLVKTIPQDSPHPTDVLPEDSPIPTDLLQEDSPFPADVMLEDSPFPADVMPEDSPFPADVMPEDSPFPADVMPEDSPFPADVMPEDSPFPADVMPEDRPFSADVLPKDSPFSAEVLPEDCPLPPQVLPEDCPLPPQVLPEDCPLSPEVLPEDCPLPTDLLPKDSPLPTELPEDSPLPTELPEDSPLPIELPEDSPLPTELPEDSPLPTELPEDSPLPTELPEDSPLPTELPGDSPLPAELPEGSPLPEELPEGSPLPAELPEDVPLPMELPEGSPLPEELPEGSPLPEELPEGSPLPEELPEGSPLPAELPEDVPLPMELPEGSPLPTELPEDVPLPMELPEDVPLPRELPEDVPLPRELPEGSPLLTELPEGSPLLTELPEGSPLLTELPEGSPLLTELPEGSPLLTELPEGSPLLTELPEGSPLLAELPEGSPLLAELPEGSPLLAELPEGSPLPAELPEGSPLPAELPEGSPLPAELPEGSPLPAELSEGSPLPAELSEGGPLPAELPEGGPLPAEELPEGGPLPAEELPEGSPLPAEELPEGGPLPTEELMEESSLPTEELMEESSLPTEEFIKSPLPTEDLLEKNPLCLSEPVMLTATELVPVEKAVSESIAGGAASLVSSAVPFKSALGQPLLPDQPYDPDLDIEVDFPRAAEDLDTESDFLLPLVFGEEYEVQPRPRPLKKGAKRKALDYEAPDDGSENSESVFPFKYCYGLNAWKHWARTQADNLPDVEEPNCIKSVKLKEELLQHSPSEISSLLARFVSEVRRPNGESYAPDSIYYLCLGIQEFLSSSRKVNIFADPEYKEFGEKFNKILRSWQPGILPDGSIFSRIEEDYLWHINQLGIQSPMSLLFTLFYFNTKYFNLKTVDQHLRLSFGSVFKRLKNNPLTKEMKSCLQYRVSSLCESGNEEKISSGKRKHEEDEPLFEQVENTTDPSRCPVKIFEYYLSKSPQNLNQRMDLFYLNPESSASPDSFIWYTSSSLDRNTLENMLIRVLLVKDIYDKNSFELDEDTD